jgi:dimethylglycine dehydrogenase
MDTKGVIGSLRTNQEGYPDNTGTVHAYASAHKQRCVTVIEHNPALDLNQRANGTWNMVPEKGAIHA